MSENLEIEGVEVTAGLKRTAGNRKLYEKLLRNFINNNQDFGDQILSFLSSGDRISAERISHTLKGNAGNLGADSLYHLFKELDDELRKDSPEITAVTALISKAIVGLKELKENVIKAGVSLQESST